MLSKKILFRRILPALFITSIVLTVITFFTLQKSSHNLDRVDVNFSLETVNGDQFNQDKFLKKPSIIFFGFTHCPDVCPSSLQLLSNLIQDLGDDASKINFYFVTADPDRDTKKILKEYLGYFDKKIIGITGDKAELNKLYGALNIYIKRIDLNNNNYTIDHTASFIVLNSNAEIIGTMIHEGFSKLLVIDNFGKIQFPKEEVKKNIIRLLQL
jgi:protein SCO1/2